MSADFIDFESRQEHFAEQFRADQAAGSQKILANTEEVLDQLRQSQVEHQRHGAQVQQNFYCFLAASPAFDSKTGTCAFLRQEII